MGRRYLGIIAALAFAGSLVSVLAAPVAAGGREGEPAFESAEGTGATRAEGTAVAGDPSDATGQSDGEVVGLEEQADAAAARAAVPGAGLDVEEDGAGEGSPTELAPLSTRSAADDFAKRHGVTIPNGRYAITSKLSSKFSLDVRGGSTADGASVILYSARVADNQRWDITCVEGGYVTIQSALSGKYLQAGWDGKRYLVVQNSKSTGDRSQLWIISRDDDGYYEIISANDVTRVLDVQGAKATNGRQILAYRAGDGAPANQRWSISVPNDVLDHEASVHRADIKDGTYLLSSAMDESYVLDLRRASRDNGAAIILYAKGPKINQGWTIVHNKSGYVTITSALTGKVLDVKGGKGVAGTQVVQWTDKQTGARNQAWIASIDGDGVIKFTSALGGSTRLVLGVTGGVAANGATISLQAKLDGPDDAQQRWVPLAAPRQYAHARDVADGTFAIATELSMGKVLDVSGNSVSDNAKVKLWTSKFTTNQMWVISHDNQGFVHLTNKNSGKELACVDGAIVQSSKAYGWVFERQSNGRFKIRSGPAGTYLDVSRSNIDNKTNKIILYKGTSGKNQLWNLATPAMTSNLPIMGASQVTQAQAVRYLNGFFRSTGRSLPAQWIKDGETVEKLVRYFWEEGEAEGVRGDVAFAQSLHETGRFQFGGDAVPSQYNFAGIGTTGGGVQGARFPNARIGIRAQIQHLKAYASTAPLNQACVDPRFSLVTRGCAPTIAGLSGKWAVPGYDGTMYYHDYLLRYLKAMLSS